MNTEIEESDLTSFQQATRDFLEQARKAFELCFDDKVDTLSRNEQDVKPK